MQYTNSEEASVARATSQVALLVLGVGVVVTCLGDDESLDFMQGPMLLLTLLCLMAIMLGGFSELSIQGDRTYLEMRASPIFMPKGRAHTYSIEAERMISSRLINLVLFHYLSVHYVSHHSGREKVARLGLSLMGRRPRQDLRRLLELIKNDNALRNTQR